MRKIPKNEIKWLVLIFSGGVFGVFAISLAIKAIILSGSFFSIGILLIAALGIGGFGWNKLKKERSKR